MNDIALLILPAVAGAGLGVFFYGGLYLTVTRGLQSRHPARWFLFSFALRSALVLSGFYVINDGHWQRLAACVTGFMAAGIAFRLWRPSHKAMAVTAGSIPIDALGEPGARSAPQARVKKDAHHAP